MRSLTSAGAAVLLACSGCYTHTYFVTDDTGQRLHADTTLAETAATTHHMSLWGIRSDDAYDPYRCFRADGEHVVDGPAPTDCTAIKALCPNGLASYTVKTYVAAAFVSFGLWLPIVITPACSTKAKPHVND